jgi:DNA topoisomerase-3
VILYIAEKPSVGRAIAAVLPGGQKKDESGFILCGRDVVAWAAGHLLESADPEDYDSSFREWNPETLPILPSKWKRIPKKTRKGDGGGGAHARKLLSGIGKLLKKADSVVNAGDADREGQFLIDEILEHHHWRGPTKRLRINDVNPDAVRKALREMQDNSKYIGEYLAGQGRDMADWISGINLTRYCTLLARGAGYDIQMFSVGRVQTPTLGLVVNRDREIENFVSKKYFALSIRLSLSHRRSLIAKWMPRDDQEGLDEEKHLIFQEICEQIREKTGTYGVIEKVEKKPHRKSPPLPYSLPKLQIDMSKKYDITDTMMYAQNLYERGYITYPRTDCSYLPEGQHSQAKSILDAISVSGSQDIMNLIQQTSLTRKSPAWNDSQIAEHHAIIPTTKVPIAHALSDGERKAYDLIALRYAIQFLPDYEYEQTIVTVTAGGENYRATGRTVTTGGWMLWEKEDESDKNAKGRGKEENDDVTHELPNVEESEGGELETFVEEKKTNPPKRFTYETLIAAMNGIHAYVSDPEIKKMLKDLDGIGTAATQEGIVKKLFDLKRNYLVKEKKNIISTPLGRALIDLLTATKHGSALVKPDLTALWERKLSAVEAGTLPLENFISEVSSMVSDIVTDSDSTVPELDGVQRGGQTSKIEKTDKKCLKEGCEGFLNLIPRKDGSGSFFSCPECKATYSADTDGNPVLKSPAIEADCPSPGCGGTAQQRNGQYGAYWVCKKCGNKFNDLDGKPVVKEKKFIEVQCPVKKCKGKAVQYPSKFNEGAFYWKCHTCGNIFDDVNGEPVVRTGKGKK